MPVNSDIRQSVILALQAEGVDALGIVRDAMRDVQGQIAVLNEQFDGSYPAEYLRSLQSLGKTLDWLAGQEKELTQALNVGVQERIAAVEREARVRMEAAERAAAIDGEQMRRNADRHAREERAAEAVAAAELEAIERVRVAEIEALGQRAQARARAERQAEQAAAAAIQAEGDVLRAKIDRLARAERAEQENAAFIRKLNQDLIEADAARFAAAESLAAQKRAALAESARIENENRAAQIEAAASLAAQKKAYLDQEVADQRKAYGEQLLAAESLAAQKAAALAKTAADEKKNRDAQVEAAASLAAQKKAYLDQERGDQMRAGAERAAREERELEALRAQLQRNADARQKEAQAEAWMTRQTEELTAALQEMHAVEKTAAVDIDRGTNAIERQARAAKEAAAHAAGFASAAEMGADRTKRMGYAAMNASYLLQDMQYGIGAVANNIGLMAMSAGNAFPKLDRMTASIGGTAGLGAAIMAGAVAVDLLYHNWEKISAVFGAALPPKLIGDIQGLQEELKKLTEKKWKTAVDYQDIEIATAKLQKLTALEAAYQRLRGHKTEEEEAVGKAVSEAITTHGGGDAHMTAVDRVTRAVAASMPVTESAESYTLRQKIEKARAERQDIAYEDLENLRTYQAADRENRDKAARAIVGGASMGDEAQRAELERIFRENRKKFAAMGVKDNFGVALGEAAPGPRAHAKEVDAEFEASDEKLKQSIDEIKDRFKAIRKAQREAGTDRKSRTTGSMTAVGPAFDEDLEKSIFDAMKGGATADQAMGARRAGLIPKLRARGVEEDIVQDVAAAILQKAADSAQNLIAEGKKPKLDVKADTARKKDVNDLATRFKPGVDDALERAMLGHIGAGATAEGSMARLLPQLRGKLVGAGVSADLAERVAQDIISKVMDKVNNKLSEAMLGGARSRRGAAAGLLDLEIAKKAAEGARNQGAINKQVKAGDADEYGAMFAGATGANEGQARQAGKQIAGLVEKGATVEQAMTHVFNQMVTALNRINRSQLQQLAMMEAASGVIGAATLQLNQMDARTRALGANLRTLNNQGKKNAQNKGPLLPAMNPGTF